MRILFISNRVARLRSRVSDAFTLPERFKGTVVEKWANYWRGLLSDYKDVAVGAVNEVRNKPGKALRIAGVAYALYAAAERNPDREAFTRIFRECSNELVLVPRSLQNPESAEYVRTLECAINQKKLRLLSLGICSLLWLDLYDEDDCTYPAECEYTRVSFWNFHHQVIDVGFWNHFWRLDWHMRNFDVNYL